jgi:hypothetical protein
MVTFGTSILWQRRAAEKEAAGREMLKQDFSHRDRDRLRQHVADFKRSTQKGC